MRRESSEDKGRDEKGKNYKGKYEIKNIKLDKYLKRKIIS